MRKILPVLCEHKQVSHVLNHKKQQSTNLRIKYNFNKVHLKKRVGIFMYNREHICMLISVHNYHPTIFVNYVIY